MDIHTYIGIQIYRNGMYLYLHVYLCVFLYRIFICRVAKKQYTINIFLSKDSDDFLVAFDFSTGYAVGSSMLTTKDIMTNVV